MERSGISQGEVSFRLPKCFAEVYKSDIDIAIVLESIPDFFATQRQLMKLRRKIDLRIEPHPIKEQDFNSLNPFAYEIKKSGIEIAFNE